MNYVTNVADLFLARFRNVSILTPTDFLIIAEWEKQEIPLEIIFESINKVWDETRNQSPKIESIREIQSCVKQNFINWLKTNAVMN